MPILATHMSSVPHGHPDVEPEPAHDADPEDDADDDDDVVGK